MIVKQILEPASIVVVGGSDDLYKPGGAVLRNLQDGTFKGMIRVVNPKAESVQGIPAHPDVRALHPGIDLAILAIAACHCPAAVDVLAREKGTRAFIILSAGFHEEGEEGARLERQVVDTIDAVGGTLIGPNCIGVLTSHYNGAFTSPTPRLAPLGVDLISGSGATAIFIMDSGMQKGIKFNSMFSVGNSARVGVEEILEFLDETFDPATSSRIKLLYVESIDKPAKFLLHASSLSRKGCHLAAIKSGGSLAGSRAASSHTGALATPDIAVDALFRAAGIVRCHARDELMTVAGIFTYHLPRGRNIPVITHAGGPAVMLTDALSNGGMEVPRIEGEKAASLLAKLHPGSSTANPIDFLATGTAPQLEHIIDACENDFDQIDAMTVIFGSPGLFPVHDVYEILDRRIATARKPLYPVFPSRQRVQQELDDFVARGRAYFPDEVLFGEALCKVCRTPPPRPSSPGLPGVDEQAIRAVIDAADDGYLPPRAIHRLLDAAGIPRAT